MCVKLQSGIISNQLWFVHYGPHTQAAMILACYWHSEYVPGYFSFFSSLLLQWKVAFKEQKKRQIKLIFY